MNAYSLLLQSLPSAGSFEVEAVEAALEARGAKRGADGRLTWTFGIAEVRVKRVTEGAAAVAVELLVPLDERPQLVRRVLEQALLVAAAARVGVIDPHLGRPVAAADEGDVEASFQRVARYVAELDGRAPPSGAPGVGLFGPSVRRPSLALRGGALLWAAVAVFLFALWLGSKLMGALR